MATKIQFPSLNLIYLLHVSINYYGNLCYLIIPHATALQLFIKDRRFLYMRQGVLENISSTLDGFSRTCGKEGMELYTSYLIYGNKTVFFNII